MTDFISLSRVETANAIGLNLSEFAGTNSDGGYEEVNEEPEESLANDIPDTSIAIQTNHPIQVNPPRAPSLHLTSSRQNN